MANLDCQLLTDIVFVLKLAILNLTFFLLLDTVVMQSLVYYSC